MVPTILALLASASAAALAQGPAAGMATDSTQTAAATADSTRPRSLDTPSLTLRLGMGAERTQEVKREGDAWGVKRNGALAVGEILVVNGIVWAFNEYPRGANFTQVNPRSWYENIKGGFKWDDNNFSTNMYAHPFHGNLYFNSARANGFTFWESIPFAFLGSAFWECCGETHKPAINDWLTTSIGGSIIGEALYRLSSSVLDNQATGAGRAWREIGAGLLNPVRGFTRVVTGRAWTVAQNPERRADHHPERIENTLAIGARSLFDKNPVANDSLISGFVRFTFQFGTPFSDEAHKPFDWFQLDLQLNSRDKERLGVLQIRGMLASKVLNQSPRNRLFLGATMNFDYINNQAIEFGGESVTGTLVSIWPLSSKFSFLAEFGADAQIFGGVNSEYSFIVVTPEQERLREYDFGVGGGGRTRLALRLHGRDFLSVRYRLLFLPALNGGVGTLPEVGDINTTHFLHALAVGLNVPIVKKFGVGADFQWYRRTSNMHNDLLENIVQQVREARLYGTWALSLTGVK